jgi:hypothetical protein
VLLGFGVFRVLLGSALWASWVLPLYTPCVLRIALRFFNEISITYQKKKVLINVNDFPINR